MLPWVEIGNSFCELKGFSSSVISEVREVLTYTDEEALRKLNYAKESLKFARYRKKSKLVWFLTNEIQRLEGATEVCIMEGTKFPTGVLYLVIEVLENYRFEIQDNRVKPEKYLDLSWPSSFKLRYYQDEMVEIAVAEHRGVLEAAVGTGKSVVIAKIIQELGVNTLIITPSADLKVQMGDFLAKMFGEENVEQITKKSLNLRKLPPIRVANIQTLTAMQKKGNLPQILKGVDAIFFDEAHHIAANSFHKILPAINKIYYRFGTSGTFLRADSKILNMYGVLSDVLYRYSAKQAIAEGFLTPLKVIVHTIPGIHRKNYNSEYKGNYCGNEKLLGKILEILEDYVFEDQQVLGLVKQKDASGKLIHEFLEEYGIDNEYISGDDKKSRVKQVLEAFNEKEVKILVGSTIIGEGIDIRSTDHLLMAQGGKSEIAITQATGRAVRLFPGKKIAVLHEFNFEGTKYLQDHLIERLDIYRKNFDAEIEVI